MLVARDDPLDTYLVHHPEALFGRPVEASVFDPDNPHVLGPHLCAAAHESPLSESDLALFGPRSRECVDDLTEAGLLRRRAQGWYWTDRRRACDLTDIRSAGGLARPARRVGHGPGDRHRRRRGRARHRPCRRRLRPPGRDLAGRGARPRGAGGGDDPGDRGLLDDGPRDHRHQRRGGPRDPGLGRGEPGARRGRGDAPGRVLPDPPLPHRRGGRRDAPGPPAAHAAHHGRVVDDARRSPGRGRTGGGRPARRGARRRALRDRAAPAVRDLRPLGHRRRLDGAPPRHGSAHGVRLRRAPRRRGLLRARLPGRRRTGWPPPARRSPPAAAPRAAPPASSRPSAATRTAPWTSPARCCSSTPCSRAGDCTNLPPW